MLRFRAQCGLNWLSQFQDKDTKTLLDVVQKYRSVAKRCTIVSTGKNISKLYKWSLHTGCTVQSETSVDACGSMSANYLTWWARLVEVIPKSITHLSLSVSVVGGVGEEGGGGCCVAPGASMLSAHKHRADITLTSVRNQDTYITNRTGMVSFWCLQLEFSFGGQQRRNTCLHLNGYEKHSDDGNDC